MPSEFELGWRDRAIALATLGAVAIDRSGSSRSESEASARLRCKCSRIWPFKTRQTRRGHAGIPSLSVALRCDEEVLEKTLWEVAQRDLLVYTPDEQFREDHDTIDEYTTDQPVVGLTSLGVEHVELWLSRLRPLFRGWSPDRPDVDDAIG